MYLIATLHITDIVDEINIINNLYLTLKINKDDIQIFLLLKIYI